MVYAFCVGDTMPPYDPFDSTWTLMIWSMAVLCCAGLILVAVLGVAALVVSVSR